MLTAWAVAAVGIVRDREPDAATRATPRIEKKAPTKPYYTFMIAVPV